MSKDPYEIRDPSGIMKMSPEEIGTDTLARQMAGRIVLDLVGTGMSKDQLASRYQELYALRRNELENFVGLEKPYAESQIKSGEISDK